MPRETRWSFTHPETGWRCHAVYEHQGGLLCVEVDQYDYFSVDDLSWGEEHPADETEQLIRQCGLDRTCVASRDAAYRELRAFGAPADDLNASEQER